MLLPSINFLNLTVSEIQAGQTFLHRPPAHLDTMGENNTPTALKGGVMICYLLKSSKNDNHMNILTTYFTVSCLFTFVHQGMMYTEFNSYFIYPIQHILYTLFQNCAKDVSTVTAQHTILNISMSAVTLRLLKLSTVWKIRTLTIKWSSFWRQM